MGGCRTYGHFARSAAQGGKGSLLSYPELVLPVKLPCTHPSFFAFVLVHALLRMCRVFSWRCMPVCVSHRAFPVPCPSLDQGEGVIF